MTGNANTTIAVAVYSRNTSAPRTTPLDERAARTAAVVNRPRAAARDPTSVAVAAREDIERRIAAASWAIGPRNRVATLEPVAAHPPASTSRSHRLEA